MNIRVMRIWLMLCGCHALITVILPLIKTNWAVGIALIYLAVLLLSKIGATGLVIPADGWGWPSPKIIGWALGILIWLVLYYFIAFLMARVSTLRKKFKKERI